MDNLNQPDNRKESLRDLIIGKIQNNKVKMHSRAYFFMQALAIIFAIALLIVLAIGVSSFLVFVLRASGRVFLPQEGFHGWLLFWGRFPWVILLIVLFLVLALELLVERFSYRRPVVYTFVGLFVSIVIAGTAIGYSTLHPFLLKQARQNHLPFAGQLYRDFGRQHDPDINRGVIVSFSGKQFILKTIDGLLTVTPSPFIDMDDLHVGDVVIVIGNIQGIQVHADIIRKTPNDPFYEEGHEEIKPVN